MALTTTPKRYGAQRSDLPQGGAASALLTLATVVIVVGALYFGRDIFVPLALAMLLSFALAPLVRGLRRLSFPNVPAVLTVVACAFLVILAFGSVIAWQLADVAGQLPTYRYNIEAKIEAVRKAPPGGQLFERATEMLRDIGRKIDQGAQPAPDASAPAPAQEREPIPVEIHEPPLTPMQIVTTIIGPLVSPLATAGIVIVFVIFMLLRREDLRDRLIRLAGGRDLPRTTHALDDAARRVGKYLLMQLVVNTLYAVPITVGLWLIGIPNPILWGLICGTMRFVPYIGPIVASFFPLALSIAVDPGWTTLFLTGTLFIVVELIINNFAEPLLYGASTGLSAIAIIVSAVFWTWLWGPIGLLLSTPLTVCLVVLGRHVPQLGFLDVLLGSEPVLSEPQLLYRRLLVGDPEEATERAEEFLRKHPLVSFYDDVAVPALAIAETDRVDGRLSEEQRVRVADSAMMLVDNLAEWEGEPEPSPEEPREGEAQSVAPEALDEAQLAVLKDLRVVVAGARGELDDAAAAMLAQLLQQQGAQARVVAHDSLQSATLREIDLGDPAVVVLSYMNSDSLAHARFLVRRIRRRLPGAKIVIGFWNFPDAETGRRNPLEATRADGLATSLNEATRAVAAVVSPAAEEADAATEPRRLGELRAVPSG